MTQILLLSIVLHCMQMQHTLDHCMLLRVWQCSNARHAQDKKPFQAPTYLHAAFLH